MYIRSQNKQKIRAFSRRDEFAIFSHRIVGLCCVIYSGNHSEGVMKEKALLPSWTMLNEKKIITNKRWNVEKRKEDYHWNCTCKRIHWCRRVSYFSDFLFKFVFSLNFTTNPLHFVLQIVRIPFFTFQDSRLNFKLAQLRLWLNSQRCFSKISEFRNWN